MYKFFFLSFKLNYCYKFSSLFYVQIFFYFFLLFCYQSIYNLFDRVVFLVLILSSYFLAIILSIIVFEYIIFCWRNILWPNKSFIFITLIEQRRNFNQFFHVLIEKLSINFPSFQVRSNFNLLNIILDRCLIILSYLKLSC